MLAERSDDNRNKVSETEEMGVRMGNKWAMREVPTHIAGYAPEKITETNMSILRRSGKTKSIVRGCRQARETCSCAKKK